MTQCTFVLSPLAVLVAAAVASGTVWAQQAAPIERVKLTDNEATCAQLHAESAEMDKVIADAKKSESDGATAATAAAAGGAAAQIAARTGLFGQVGGLLGQVVGSVAAQSAATAGQQSAQQTTQQAQERGRQATARKERVTTLFLAKDCKVSDLSAQGKTLTPEDMQKVAAASPAVAAGAAAANAAAPPPSDLPGARSLVEKVAAPARAAAVPEVPLRSGAGGNFKTVLGKSPKLAIAGYRVGFVMRNSATAYAGAGLANFGQSTGSVRTITQAQNKKIEVGLENVNLALMQAITDQLYADFVEQLKATGREIVPFELVATTPQFQKLIVTPPTPGAPYAVSPSGDARQYFVMAPTGVPLYFFNSEPLGDQGLFALDNFKSLMALSLDKQVVALTAQVVIDFAEVSSSGRSNFGNRAEVGAQPAISLASMNSVVWAIHSTNAIMGEYASLRPEQATPIPGDYANERTVESFDTAGLANSLTMLTGTQGVQRFSEKKAYTADPAKYAELALRTGLAANRAFTAPAKP